MANIAGPKETDMKVRKTGDGYLIQVVLFNQSARGAKLNISVNRHYGISVPATGDIDVESAGRLIAALKLAQDLLTERVVLEN